MNDEKVPMAVDVLRKLYDENALMRAALIRFVERYEDPSVRDAWELNDEYIGACAAIGRTAKDIA